MENKMYFLFVIGPRSIMGSLLEQIEDVIHVGQPLAYMEAVTQDRTTGQITDVKPIFRKPHLLATVPEKVSLVPEIVIPLNPENQLDKKLIATYEEYLQAFAAEEAGVIMPTNDQVIKLKN